MLKISHLRLLVIIVLRGFFSIKLHLRLGETEHNHVKGLNSKLRINLLQSFTVGIAKQDIFKMTTNLMNCMLEAAARGRFGLGLPCKHKTTI